VAASRRAGSPANFVDPSGLCVFGAPCPERVKKVGGEAIASGGDDGGGGLYIGQPGVSATCYYVLPNLF